MLFSVGKQGFDVSQNFNLPTKESTIKGIIDLMIYVKI